MSTRQQEIVHRVEELFALVDQIKARFTRAAAQVDKPALSVLARAFAGNLVPPRPQRRTSGEIIGTHP